MKDTVAIYARISREKDDVDVSIGQQIKQGKEFAESRGMDYLVYKDEGVSGTLPTKERPAMFQLLQDIVKKDSPIKILWGREAFRLYRGNDPRYEIQLVCKKHNVQIYYGDKPLGNDPNDKLLDGILGVLGSFYVDLTRQNIKQAIDKNYQDGKAHGIAPYGYRKGRGKVLELDPDQAKVVRQIFDWHADGFGVESIAKKMNDNEVPTHYEEKYERFSKTWNPSVVYKILRNSMYHGKRMRKGKEYPIPPIVTERVFHRSATTFKSNKNHTGKRTFHKYLLNDLLVCSHCADRYLGRAGKKCKPAYRCNGRRQRKGCKNREVNQFVLERLIWNYVSDGETLLRNLLQSGENGNFEAKKKELQKEIDTLDRVGEKLNSHKSNIVRLAIEGILSDGELKKDKARIEREAVENDLKRENVREQMETLRDKSELQSEIYKRMGFVQDIDLELFKNSKDNFDDILKGLQETGTEVGNLKTWLTRDRFSHNEKQEFLHKVVNRIEIDYNGKFFTLRIVFNLPLEDAILYVDRKMYFALGMDGRAIDLGHELKHNFDMNLERLRKEVGEVHGN